MAIEIDQAYICKIAADGTQSAGMRLLRLWAIAQLFYRQPLGEYACDMMHEVCPDASIVDSYFLMSGLCLSGELRRDVLMRLIEGQGVYVGAS